MNKNPAWKYLILVILVAFGVIYATPNLYIAAPGVQVVGVRNADIDQAVLDRVDRALAQNDIQIETIGLQNGAIRARLESEEDQTKAQGVLKRALGANYGVALADIPTTPSWLASMGGAPMYLGLDLRGGVHFLLQVDMQAAQQRAEENYEDDLKRLFQENKLRYLSVKREAAGTIKAKFKSAELRDLCRVSRTYLKRL